LAQAGKAKQISQPTVSGIVAARVTLAESTLDLQPTAAVSPIVIAGLWRIAEAALTCVLGGLIYWLYVFPQIGWQSAYVLAIPLFSVLAIITLQAFDLFHIGVFRTPLIHAPRLIAGWTMAFLIAFSFVFFLKLEGVFSRVFMVAWYGAGLATLLFARICLSAGFA
jgi:CoA-binding domain